MADMDSTDLFELPLIFMSSRTIMTVGLILCKLRKVHPVRPIRLQLQVARRNDAAIQIDPLDAFCAVVVIRCDEPRIGAEVQILCDQFALYAEKAVGETFQ